MKIIADSGSLMSLEEAKSLDVALVPLQVELRGKNYKDYLDIDAKTFIEQIQTSVPISSQPAVGDVVNAFESCDEGIFITLTKGLSSTYDSALGIAQAHDAKHITIINSQTLAANEYYLVQLAARLAKQHSISEVVERIEVCKKECQSWLIPVDFNFLKRNGRLSLLAATMGGLLKLKAIVYHKPGMEKLEKFGAGRTWTQAFDMIIEQLKELKVSQRHLISISHALNEEVALAFQQRVIEKLGDLDIHIVELSPAMITQGGPGCVALQYILKDDLA